MSNYCSNELTIKGLKKEIVNFFSKCDKEKKFSFNDFVPMPKTFKNYDTTNKPHLYKKQAEYQKKKYGIVGWYDWSCKYWGTKWNAYDSPLVKDIICDIEDYKDEDECLLSIFFNTAWSPCTPFVEKIAKMYPELEFCLNYIETGCCFCGHFHAYTIDGDIEIDEEEGEPTIVDCDNNELTEEDCRKLEEEYGFEECCGFGEIYFENNPYYKSI